MQPPSPPPVAAAAPVPADATKQLASATGVRVQGCERTEIDGTYAQAERGGAWPRSCRDYTSEDVNLLIEGRAYGKAIESLQLARKACKADGNWPPMNAYLRELKLKHGASGAPGYDFWSEIVKSGVSLIDKSECEDSDTSVAQSVDFLTGPKPLAEPATAAAKPATSGKDLFAQGKERYGEGEYKEALALYTQALTAFSEADVYWRAVCHNQCGTCHGRMGQGAEAVVSYTQAIASGIAKEQHIWHQNRGMKLKAMGEFVRATKDFERVIELKPESKQAEKARGYLKQIVDPGGYAETESEAQAERERKAEAQITRDVGLVVEGLRKKKAEDGELPGTKKPCRDPSCRDCRARMVEHQTKRGTTSFVMAVCGSDAELRQMSAFVVVTINEIIGPATSRQGIKRLAAVSAEIFSGTLATVILKLECAPHLVAALLEAKDDVTENVTDAWSILHRLSEGDADAVDVLLGEGVFDVALQDIVEVEENQTRIYLAGIVGNLLMDLRGDDEDGQVQEFADCLTQVAADAADALCSSTDEAELRKYFKFLQAMIWAAKQACNLRHRSCSSRMTYAHLMCSGCAPLVVQVSHLLIYQSPACFTDLTILTVVQMMQAITGLLVLPGFVNRIARNDAFAVIQKFGSHFEISGLRCVFIYKSRFFNRK